MPLLTTELRIPPLQPQLIERLRPIQCLNDRLPLGQQLIPLSAPTGFGKTTLVNEWRTTPGVYNYPLSRLSSTVIV
jgi:ATP/maltotriose-dependent transcriptional regulator MalT